MSNSAPMATFVGNPPVVWADEGFDTLLTAEHPIRAIIRMRSPKNFTTVEVKLLNSLNVSLEIRTDRANGDVGPEAVVFSFNLSGSGVLIS